ncbi:MAG: hypothetical protein M1827_005019 [Pycnora praestabilis]|nr:MAG: hypothetical protein M1827_005019 [Pycnora praestabilis]
MRVGVNPGIDHLYAIKTINDVHAKDGKLLAIRLGPGAAVLPKDVARIHMDFAYKLNDGHLGPRSVPSPSSPSLPPSFTFSASFPDHLTRSKFWRHSLPRLKYHNPAVSMTVNRTQDQTGPATLTVFFAPPPASTSPTASPTPTSSTSTSTTPSDYVPHDRSQTINMKNRHESEILSQLIAVTKAMPIEATPREQEELREMEEVSRRAERDRRVSATANEKSRRREAMLAQARGEVAEARAAA